MRKLGCNAAPILGNSIEQNMELIKKAGFDSTFFEWNKELDLEKLMAKAKELDLAVETLHAPFGEVNCLWEEGTEGDYYTEELRLCILAAAKYNIPYVIMHTTVSSSAPKTSHIALTRFGKLVREAEKQGVKLAFENLEFIRHLSLILYTFKSENVGFCYDVGHEVCYTPGLKYLPLYGDRLFGTHLNDNLGIRDFNGKTTYIDDLHLLPFDGIGDWDGIAKRLVKCGFDGILTFELIKTNSNGRYNRTKYQMLPLEGYIAECYAAACRVSALCEKYS